MNKLIIFTYILLFIAGCDNDYYKGIRLDKIVKKAINNPESVFFDKDSNYLYVSNINGKSLEKDGNGFISVLSLEGEIIEDKLVDGLNAPKGIFVKNNLIYIIDINQLIIFNLETKETEEIREFNNAISLNDITISDNGKRIFISDFLGNKLFEINEDKIVYEHSIIKPNGLYIYDNQLYIGTFQLNENGHIFRLNLNDKNAKIESYLTNIGFCDGIYIDDYLIAISNFDNEFKLIDKKSNKIISKAKSENFNFGDFYYSESLIISPSLKSSEILFLKFD
tara:strand:- start:272 stop:1111 length:840 start_codon:yes stop_codon:yes gene_type:complete